MPTSGLARNIGGGASDKAADESSGKDTAKTQQAKPVSSPGAKTEETQATAAQQRLSSARRDPEPGFFSKIMGFFKGLFGG